MMMVEEGGGVGSAVVVVVVRVRREWEKERKSLYLLLLMSRDREGRRAEFARPSRAGPEGAGKWDYPSAHQIT